MEIADYTRVSRKNPMVVQGHMDDGQEFVFSYSQGTATLTVGELTASCPLEVENEFVDEETFLATAESLIPALA